MNNEEDAINFLTEFVDQELIGRVSTDEKPINQRKTRHYRAFQNRRIL